MLTIKIFGYDSDLKAVRDVLRKFDVSFTTGTNVIEFTGCASLIACIFDMGLFDISALRDAFLNDEQTPIHRRS